MTRTKTITTYSYKELEGKAKERAMQWLIEGSYYTGYCEHANEDAKSIGLKITSSDVDRNRHAKGEFIGTALETAEAILKEHGKVCETYKTAERYLPSLSVPCPADEDSYDQWETNKADAEHEFLHDLLEDYSVMIQYEYEYSHSEEYASDVAAANDYQFDEDGKIT